MSELMQLIWKTISQKWQKIRSLAMMTKLQMENLNFGFWTEFNLLFVLIVISPLAVLNVVASVASTWKKYIARTHGKSIGTSLCWEWQSLNRPFVFYTFDREGIEQALATITPEELPWFWCRSGRKGVHTCCLMSLRKWSIEHSVSVLSWFCGNSGALSCTPHACSLLQTTAIAHI